MVGRVKNVNGELVLELDPEQARELGVRENDRLVVHVSGADAVSPEFERRAREVLHRHAATFEKLSK